MIDPANEIRVSSWSELMESLHSSRFIYSQASEGDHLRSPYVFRGMDVADWTLQTALERLPKKSGANIKVIETSLIRAFRKYANSGSFDEKSEWYILAVAQHNGLPTRVLDWSYSPLIAAHFACGDEAQKHKDGVIWCLHAGSLREINEDCHSVSSSLRGIAWVYDTRLLEERYTNLAALDASHVSGNLMLLWEPPSLDSRIANQAGLLSIMNDAATSQSSFLQSGVSHKPDLLWRIIINSSAKSEIRDMLDQNGISERTIFPGLPGLCNWLKRYYGKAW